MEGPLQNLRQSLIQLPAPKTVCLPVWRVLGSSALPLPLHTHATMTAGALADQGPGILLSLPHFESAAAAII